MAASQGFDFCSGDALIFNSSTEWNVRHGITNIIPNTAPDFLPDSLKNCRTMLQYRQLPIGAVRKEKNHVVFTVKEALAIHKVLHTQLAAITVRGVSCPVQTTDNGTRWMLVHGIVCCQQDSTVNSQWAEYVRKGYRISWIKSPGHWGRIVNGKIGNKGSAISGQAEDYHRGALNLDQPIKKQKISVEQTQSIFTKPETTTTEDISQVIPNEEDISVEAPGDETTFLFLVEYQERKKKMSIAASSILQILEQFQKEFEVESVNNLRFEYEDEDFKEFVTPANVEEIPLKAKVRIVPYQ